MRDNIFDRQAKFFDFQDEIDRIDELLSVGDSHSKPYHINYGSVEDTVERYAFKTWPARVRWTSCDNMRNALNIGRTRIAKGEEFSDDEKLDYLEYAANMAMLCEEGLHHNFFADDTTKDNLVAVKKNIRDVLDTLNYEAVYDETNHRMLVVPKNAASTAVAEIVKEDLAHLVIKYNHHTLKGDIQAKKDILLALGSELEPQRAALTKCNKDLATNIFFMLNNLNIRHNNRSKKDKNYNEYVAKIRPIKLESWYDELYQMILLAFLELDQQARNDRVNELKEKVKGGNAENGQI